MKQTILLLFILISLGASAQGVSKEDSIKQRHQIDSMSTLIRTKLSINAVFIDSVFELSKKEQKKFYTLDDQDIIKYSDAIQAQQQFINRLVNAWREQYSKIKKP